MDKYLKMALIAMSLMIGIGVFYHYVIYLPAVERHKVEKAEEEKRTAEEKETQTQSKYEICIDIARLNYEADWAKACEYVAKSEAEDLKACLSDSTIINNRYMGINYCKKKYIFLDSSPKCLLPKTKADSINESHKQAQDRCLTEARVGL
jgi:hypothetical protein